MMIIPVYYPLQGDNFDYSPIFYEDIMSILSVYNKTSIKLSHDIMYMFQPIGDIWWFTIIITSLIFIIIHSIGVRILVGKRTVYDIVWKTIRSSLNQIVLPSNSIFVSICSLLLLIFLFFTLNYIATSATTSLVTIDKPMTIESYDDIFERKICVIIKKVWAEYGAIKELKIESKERKLLSRSKDASLLPSMEEYLDQKCVAIARLTVTTFYGIALMALTNRKHDRALVKIDDHASKFTQVFIFHKSKDTFFQDLFSDILTKALEHGLTEYEMRYFAQRSAKGIIGQELSPSLERKVSSSIELDQIDWSQIMISNTGYLFIVYRDDKH